MSQNWRTNPIVAEALKAAQYCHFYRVDEKNQSKLAGTMAVLEANDRIIAGFSVVHENDNGSRRIGRNIASGRAARVIAEDLELVDPGTEDKLVLEFENETSLREFITNA